MIPSHSDQTDVWGVGRTCSLFTTHCALPTTYNIHTANRTDQFHQKSAHSSRFPVVELPSMIHGFHHHQINSTSTQWQMTDYHTITIRMFLTSPTIIIDMSWLQWRVPSIKYLSSNRLRRYIILFPDFFISPPPSPSRTTVIVHNTHTLNYSNNIIV